MKLTFLIKRGKINFPFSKSDAKVIHYFGTAKHFDAFLYSLQQFLQFLA